MSFFIGILFYNSYWFMVLGLPLLWLIAKYRKQCCMKKRREELRQEFKEFMNSMASALNAGYALENTFSIIKKDLLIASEGKNTDLISECICMIRGLEMKKTVEELLDDFAMRSGLSEIREFASVIKIAKRTGGNMIQIIRDTSKKMEEALRAKEEIKIMVAAKRMEKNIMLLIPFAMILYLRICNPGFLDCLYGSAFGVIVMTMSLIGIGIAFLWSEKIVSFY